MINEKVLSNNHWLLKDYHQRMTIKQWREVLLNKDDQLIIFQGEVYELKAKNLGAGVVEVYKTKK